MDTVTSENGTTLKNERTNLKCGDHLQPFLYEGFVYNYYT